MTPPRTVLYLSTSGQVGGAERCLLSLAAGLNPSRYRPTVLIGSPGPFAAMLAEQGIAARLEPLPVALLRWSRFHSQRGLLQPVTLALQTPGYLRHLRRAVRAAAPAIVHTNGIKMHYAAACLPLGAHLVWHLHDFPPAPDHRPGLWSPAVWRWLSRAPALAIANSHAVAQAYADLCPSLQPRLRVVPNGVNLAALQSARGEGRGEALRRAWGWGPEHFVIGMVAIFAPWKGQEVFLRAAALVRARIPGARFVLVGDDIYDTRGHGGRRAQLEALAAQLGLGDAVHFTGFVADVAAAYAALDVMVHASTLPEPFGRTLIESMAAGTPVVAAAAAGPLEIVEHGRSGWLTPPGDPSTLAAALLDLQRQPDLRRALAAAALARVRERFEQSLIARQVTALYDELLGLQVNAAP